MLKTLILKNTPISIPIPLFTLSEAVRWIEEDLLQEDTVLVSLLLDGKEYIHELHRRSVKELSLLEDSQLQILVETPKNFQSQSLEVACDLAFGIASRIRKCDFQVWRDFSFPVKNDLEEIDADLHLLMDLMQHLLVFGEERSELLCMNFLKNKIGSACKDFERYFQNEDLESIFKVLEEDLSISLKQLVFEGEALQVKFLTSSLSS